MNAEKDDIDRGDPFHLPESFLKSRDPAGWLKQRQLELGVVQDRDTAAKSFEAIRAFGKRQKPRHRGPGD